MDALAAARQAMAAWEPDLGAVVRETDVLPPAPAQGPLAGLPLGVKDLVAVAGYPRECGAPGLVDTSPQPAHATAVARLLDAGMAVVALTATHQLAYGVVTPRTRNPRAPGRIAGGSSGGSAAAVAAGLCAVGLGTDTGGSVRIPAACCGITGLKTTFGDVPLDGIQPLSPSLDTVGPLARSVAACAAASRALRGEAAGGSLPASVRRVRVGVIAEIAAVGIDPDVRAVYETAVGGLEADGARLTSVRLPLLPQAGGAAGRILLAEALAVHARRLAAFPPDGTGRGLWMPDLLERFTRGREIDAGTLASARSIAERWCAAVEQAFTAVDVFVTPTLPCGVPAAGVDPVTVDGRPQPVTAALTRLTNPWNLAGVPAGSVPAGTDTEGAPVGLQIIGPWHAEETVLQVMAAVERRSGGPPPAVPPP